MPNFQICLKSMVEQSYEIYPKVSARMKFTPHMLLFIWLFSCTVLTTLYKSKLWSISINHYQPEPEDLAAILDEGYGLVATEEYIEGIIDILNSTDPDFEEAKR